MVSLGLLRLPLRGWGIRISIGEFADSGLIEYCPPFKSNDNLIGGVHPDNPMSDVITDLG